MPRTPIHPGEIPGDELAELGLSAAELARLIEVPPNRISQIVAGKRNIPADTALRLARYFGTSEDLRAGRGARGARPRDRAPAAARGPRPADRRAPALTGGAETVMLMPTPPHPRRIVRQVCLEPLRLTVAEAAKALGVSRFALSELVNGRRGLSPEMAIRLSKAFGSRPEIWAGLQLQYDLAQAMQKADTIKVEHVPHPA